MLGKFVTIEGPDGSGKTSVRKRLVELLQAEGCNDLVITREPGGSPISEQIREVILDVDNQAMDARTEALLYAASRRQHLVDTVIPAQQDGKLVISERFVDSSLAYQGVARNLPVDLIWQINHFAIEDHLPDLTLLIDVPAQVGIDRIHRARGSRQFDRLDQESLAFHELVRQAFLDLAAANPERIIVVDGQESLEEVAQACLSILRKHEII